MPTNNNDNGLVGVLDTAMGTTNLGDAIIMDAASRVVTTLFPRRQPISLPTHLRPGWHGLDLQRATSLLVACGTNLLHAHMGLVQQWRVGPLAAARMRPVVLLGVGWRSHASRRTDPYTRWLLRRLLSPHHLHSVRDSYSEARLREAGVDNVINTGCPTLWQLTASHCRQIPATKGRDAVFVVTDYSRNREADAALLDKTLRSYRRVYFWAQGRDDVAYRDSLPGGERTHLLPRNLAAYDALLADSSQSIDYVGTRLHGGIRALQHGRRSLIVGVDHRALSMGRDFQLPVVDRYADQAVVDRWIAEDRPTEVQPPWEAIGRWRAQFGAERRTT